MEELRESENILIIGAPGCGKTTLAKEFMEGKPGLFFSQAVRDRGLADVPVIHSSKLNSIINQNQFYKICEPLDWDAALKNMYTHYVNGTVYYDDIGQMVSGNVTKGIKSIMGQVRHNCNDQIYSFWNPNHVPPFMYDMMNRILIFKTGVGPKDLRETDKIPRFEFFKEAMAWVEEQDPIKYKHCYAYMIKDPLNPASKLPFDYVDPITKVSPHKFYNVRKP